MERFGRIILLTLGLGLFAIALSFFPRRPVVAAPPTPTIPVNVTNTPLPVTGNVNASITNASVPVSVQNAALNVNAAITNTPNVNVANLPTVQLAAGTTVGVTGGTFSLSNTPTTPIFTRDVDNPAQQPFVGTLCAGTQNCSSMAFSVPLSIAATSTPVVRLVIEYYSIECFGVTAPDVPTLYFNIFTGGTEYIYYPGPLVLSSDGNYYSNQQTRIYADPGSSVQLGFFNPGGSNACNVTVSGYLVHQ